MIAAAAGLDDGQCAGGRIEPDFDIVVDFRRWTERKQLAAQVLREILLSGVKQGSGAFYVSPRLGIFFRLWQRRGLRRFR